MGTEVVHPQATQDAIAEEDLAQLRKTLENSPLARHLGIEFTEVEAGRATARLPGDSRLTNFLGYAHTGALFALAEQVMAAAANSIGYMGLPLDCELHFLKGANPLEAVVAVARLVDTQGRIARVGVELTQGGETVARLNETVYLRSTTKG